MPVKKPLPKPQPAAPKPAAKKPGAKKAPAAKTKGQTSIAVGFTNDAFVMDFDVERPPGPLYSLCGKEFKGEHELFGVGGGSEGFIVRWFVNGYQKWRGQVLTADDLPELFGVCLTERGYIIAVGSGVILRSFKNDDWQRSNYGGVTLFRVCSNKGKIWAVGDNATVLFSVDDGESWHRADIPVSGRLISVYAVDDVVLIGAYNGDFCISNDNGATWSRTQRKPATAINRIWGNSSRLYAVTNVGYFLTSTDQGKTWASEQPEGEEGASFDLEGGCTTNDGFCLVGQDKSILVKSGNTWEQVKTSCGFWDAISLGGAVYVGADNGQVFQQRGSARIELKEELEFTGD